jgi:hypothetical protein
MLIKALKKTCNILNPTSLLSSELMTVHTCEQVMVQTYASSPDLTDKPLSESEDKWFTDGRSFVLSGERKAGYAVVSDKKVIEVWSLAKKLS